MLGGLYQIVLRLSRPLTVDVGRLGALTLDAGYYVYTGSAANGLHARVSRHLRPEKSCHWHIDSLTTHTDVEVVAAWVYPSPADDLTECQLNQATAMIPGATVPASGFGASDCVEGCDAHLLAFGEEQPRLPPLHVRLLRVEMGIPGPDWEGR